MSSHKHDYRMFVWAEPDGFLSHLFCNDPSCGKVWFKSDVEPKRWERLKLLAEELTS